MSCSKLNVSNKTQCNITEQVSHAPNSQGFTNSCKFNDEFVNINCNGEPDNENPIVPNANKQIPHKKTCHMVGKGSCGYVHCTKNMSSDDINKYPNILLGCIINKIQKINETSPSYVCKLAYCHKRNIVNANIRNNACNEMDVHINHMLDNPQEIKQTEFNDIEYFKTDFDSVCTIWLEAHARHKAEVSNLVHGRHIFLSAADLRKYDTVLGAIDEDMLLRRITDRSYYSKGLPKITKIFHIDKESMKDITRVISFTKEFSDSHAIFGSDKNPNMWKLVVCGTVKQVQKVHVKVQMFRQMCVVGSATPLENINNRTAYDVVSFICKKKIN